MLAPRRTSGGRREAASGLLLQLNRLLAVVVVVVVVELLCLLLELLQARQLAVWAAVLGPAAVLARLAVGHLDADGPGDNSCGFEGAAWLVVERPRGRLSSLGWEGPAMLTYDGRQCRQEQGHGHDDAPLALLGTRPLPKARARHPRQRRLHSRREGIQLVFSL